MLAVSSLFSSLLKTTASHELVDSSVACRPTTSCCGRGNIECVNSNNILLSVSGKYMSTTSHMPMKKRDPDKL